MKRRLPEIEFIKISPSPAGNYRFEIADLKFAMCQIFRTVKNAMLATCIRFEVPNDGARHAVPLRQRPASRGEAKRSSRLEDRR